MFESDAPFTLFDYFRVPYDHVKPPGGADIVTVRVPGERPALTWPTARAITANGGRPCSFFLGDIRLFGHLARDSGMRGWMQGTGRDWHTSHELGDRNGTPIGAVWQANDGSTLLPFDPNELDRKSTRLNSSH